MHLIIVLWKISDDHFMDHKCNAYLFNAPSQKSKLNLYTLITLERKKFTKDSISKLHFTTTDAFAKNFN